MWKQPQLLSLFMLRNYFSASTGLLWSFTSPKAIDPYLLYLAESKVTGLGVLPSRREEVVSHSVRENSLCACKRQVRRSWPGNVPSTRYKKKGEGLPIPFMSFLSGPGATYSSIWAITSERVFCLAHFNCMTVFLLKIKQLLKEQRW